MSPQAKNPLSGLRADVWVFDSPAAAGRAAARAVAVCAADAVAARGKFAVAVSGGSLPGLVFPPLLAGGTDTWPAWHVFWADERLVPLDHPDSNYRLARETLLKHAPIPPRQIFPVDTTHPAGQAARAYQRTIQAALGEPPRFDLILLGMGPDGHTASLFPGHGQPAEAAAIAAPVVDSPKPPPERVTLTLPALNAARRVMFIVTGAAKADALAAVFGPKPPPAGRVQPAAGRVEWYIDRAAAQNLKLQT